jgi:hypothetical protein
MNELVKTNETLPVTPMQLLQIAMDKGADLDKLQQLMTLQERWEGNVSRKAYNEAFAAFKAEAVEIIKNKQVGDGPLKGKRYAELFAVVNAVTPALSKWGLSAAWSITKDEPTWIEVTCTLKHVAGHSESVSMGGPPDTGGAKNAIQSRASTVSYLERYTLKAITGLSEQEEDDDGGDPVQRITEAQAMDLKAKAEEVGANIPNFLKFLKVERFEDLPVSQYSKAIQLLKDKAGKK